MNIRFPFWQEVRKLLIDRGDGTYAERVEAYPPVKLLTDGDGPSARLRVDVAQTGLFAGREFRSFYEFSIGTGQSIYLKFVSPVDFMLFEQALSVDAGGVRFTAYTGGTEAGSFSTALPVIGKNRMASRPSPYYVAQSTIHTGGTHSGGTAVEVFRVVSAGATAQAATVGGQQASERGLPAGTYYLKLEALGNGTATGVYSIMFEERP